MAGKLSQKRVAVTSQHMAKVVRPGRCFVCHIYNLSAIKGRPNQLVKLNCGSPLLRPGMISLCSGNLGALPHMSQSSSTIPVNGVWHTDWGKIACLLVARAPTCPLKCSQETHPNRNCRLGIGEMLDRKGGPAHVWQQSSGHSTFETILPGCIPHGLPMVPDLQCSREQLLVYCWTHTWMPQHSCQRHILQ